MLLEPTRRLGNRIAVHEATRLLSNLSRLLEKEIPVHGLPGGVAASVAALPDRDSIAPAAGVGIDARRTGITL